MNPTSPFLAERLIARLSPQRRANLQRRLMQRYSEAGLRSCEHERRAARMLGRLAALTA